MSAHGEIRLNDIGTRLLFQFTDSGSVFDFTAVTSLSSLTALVLCLKGPVNPVKTFTPTFAFSPTLAGTTFAGDGSDGWVDYTVVSSGTWDEIDQWQIQGRVTYPGGDFRSQIKQFQVFPNICP